MRISLIIHERLGKWAAQIRPRVANWPVRVCETRSTRELELAASLSVCPIVVIGAEGSVRRAIEHVEAARRASPGAMILVANAPDLAEFRLLATELGATHVLADPLLPPQMLSWIERWLPLARARIEASGWTEERRSEPEPWETLLFGDAPSDLATNTAL